MNPSTYWYPWYYRTPWNPWHIYLPPWCNNPYHNQNRSARQLCTHLRTAGGHPQSKYPYLNPALAADMTPIRCDLRTKPRRDGMLSTMYHQPAFAYHTHHVRIVSKAIPWTLDIGVPAGSIITCGAIVAGLYQMLQEPIVDSEWGIIMHDKARKETVEKAAKVRSPTDADVVLRRIDWLGEQTVFRGLERDEEFEKRRLLPGAKACKEMWLIKFAKP